MSEHDNLLRWDGRSRGHFEAWYLTLSDLATRAGFWLRFTLDVPKTKRLPARVGVWFSAFQPHEDAPEHTRAPELSTYVELPADQLSASARPFALRVNENVFEHERMRAGIPGVAAWDLSWRAPPDAGRILPDFAYRFPVLGSQVLSVAPETLFNGEIVIGRKRFAIENAPGGQGHMWGDRHPRRWAWVRCSAWDAGEDAALEATTAVASLGGVALPPTTVAVLRLGQETFRLNGLGSLLRNRSQWVAGRWQLTAADALVRIEAQVERPVHRLLASPFFEPAGGAVQCHASEVANVHLCVYRRSSGGVPWQLERTLTASGLGHAEWGLPKTDLAVHWQTKLASSATGDGAPRRKRSTSKQGAHNGA